MDRILDALAAEFALPEMELLVAALVRLAMAALLAAVIGWEREQKGRAAGLKTHILVSTGSALFILAPVMAGIPGAENTRVMQGIVSGIGLLGAGAILRNREGTQVEGLTTAASIWMTAAIGMAAGMGLEVLAITATVLTWLVVAAIPKLIGSTPAHRGGPGPDQR
ncbi:MgtC/SapB family protein [Thermomonas carbonis]|uniref:Protein MgtC n=2 Tax=Thermomonas carbonis TaxID=1463158 RepID=A0A7G9SUP0_9GAMM|nr:MgtC/SapB family protein [Thermomonas carbonis]